MAFQTTKKKALDIDGLEAGFLNALEGNSSSKESVDLVTFMESEAWSNFPLRPRQRLLMKVVNNTHAQVSNAKDIPILPFERVRIDQRKWYANHLEEFGEPPALSGLDHCIIHAEDGTVWYDEGADYEYLLTRENKYANLIVRAEGGPADPLVVICIIGRGGSKTTMGGGMAGWKTQHILRQRDPHGYYGLQPQKPLKIQNVATAEKQAQEFFQAYKTTVGNVTWFKGRYTDLTLSMEFGSIPSKGGVHVPQLVAALASSNSRSGRGGDVIFYVHDEMAFADKGGDGKAGHNSDRAIWRAYFSAVKTRGRNKGIAMTLSSPAEADGLLYELVQQAERGELKNVILMQVATWEMIPGHTKGDYAAEYADDPDGAEMEYGAQFYSGTSNLIPNAQAKLDVAVENGRKLGIIRRRAQYWEDERCKEGGRYDRRKAARFDYAAHLDTSKGGDRLVFAVSHMEGPWTVLDHLKIWERLPHYTKELEPYVKQINYGFGGFRQLTFDQYNSLQLIQNLTDAGIHCFERTFTAEYNDAIARNMMQILSETQVTYAIYPTAFKGPMPKKGSGWDEGPDEAAISMWIARQEIQAIKKIVKAKAGSAEKRYLIAGTAPTTGTVVHDDAFDAMAASAYEARQLVMGGGHFGVLDVEGANYFANYPNMTTEVAIDAINTPGDWIMARCSFCGNSWKEASPDPLVACPACRNYTQIRM